MEVHYLKVVVVCYFDEGVSVNVISCFRSLLQTILPGRGQMVFIDIRKDG